MPRSVAPAVERANRQRFAEDVEYYLTLTPRQLPSQYLYDDLGSALFDAICRLPWYRITRAELRLLDRHALDIHAHVSPVRRLVELGPGSGEKISTLLNTIDRWHSLVVHLVDISAAALDSAKRALEAYDSLKVVAHQASYEVGLVEATQNRFDTRTLVLFLGSNIGNFDPPGADAFLRNVRAALAVGDAFLLGADLIKPARDLVLAYDDPLQVTAAFNRNLLVRANRELDADFDLDGFAHRAVWNPVESRVEMRLVSLRRQTVHIPSSRLRVEFAEGDTIWTESSYKYRPAQMVEMLERAGFTCDDQWIDETDAFALTLARAM